jgi:hypothetical protein
VILHVFDCLLHFPQFFLGFLFFLAQASGLEFEFYVWLCGWKFGFFKIEEDIAGMVSIGGVVEALVEVGTKEVHGPHHLAVIIHTPWFGGGGVEQELLDTILTTLEIAVGARNFLTGYRSIFITAYSTFSHLRFI